MSRTAATVMNRVNDCECRAQVASLSMKREYGKTPQGNAMSGRWVLRNATGAMLDFDQYSNDLAERHALKLF